MQRVSLKRSNGKISVLMASTAMRAPMFGGPFANQWSFIHTFGMRFVTSTLPHRCRTKSKGSKRRKCYAKLGNRSRNPYKYRNGPKAAEHAGGMKLKKERKKD